MLKQKVKILSSPKQIVKHRHKRQLKSEDLPPLFSPPENKQHVQNWMDIMKARISNNKYLKS